MGDNIGVEVVGNDRLTWWTMLGDRHCHIGLMVDIVNAAGQCIGRHRWSLRLLTWALSCEWKGEPDESK